MNSDLLEYVSADSLAAGLIMITSAVIGIMVNAAVMTLILRTPSFHNAFGYICFSNLAAGSCVFILILWTGPLTLFNADETITETFIGARFGQITHICWYESVYCHLQIALSRLIVVLWPFAYNKLFKGKNMVYFIAFTWIVSFLRTTPQFWYDCWVWFDVHTLSHKHHDTYCTIVSDKVNNIDTMVMCILIISINATTFYHLRKRIKLLRNASGSFKERQLSKLKGNIPFFVQGCVSAIFMMMATFSYYLLPMIATTRLQLTIVNTISWELILTSNGIILIIFNKSFRRVFNPRMLFRKTKKLVAKIFTVSMEIDDRTVWLRADCVNIGIF